MTVLLSYSTNLLANNSDIDSLHSSTGDVDHPKDSVLISYDDLRLVNSKLIELDYEKQINTNLRNIIANDSIVIQNYQGVNNRINKDYKKVIRQRNIMFGGAVVLFLTTLITIFVK